MSIFSAVILGVTIQVTFVGAIVTYVLGHIYTLGSYMVKSEDKEKSAKLTGSGFVMLSCIFGGVAFITLAYSLYNISDASRALSSNSQPSSDGSSVLDRIQGR